MENQRHPHKRKMTPEEKRRRKEKLFYQRSSKIYFKMAGIFLFFLIIAFAFNLFSKDKKYSESENRMLAQKPEFSMANLASGKYMKDMEDYVTDQFFIRDKWINLKVLEDLALGKRESNGVYIGKKEHLMEIPTAPNQKALDNNLDAISNFSASHPDINTVMTLIPNAAYVYNHLVPRNALVRDQEADIKYVQSAVGTSLNFVDLTKTMTSHKDEEIYYKTDHHWTTLGAKYAFDALSTALGIDSPTQEYTIYPVTHSFQGTLTSKSGYDKGKDTIELYIPQNVNTDCLVNFVDEGKRTASMYESAALENKDKYEVFFGGNHSRVDISTPMEGKKNLLLFKDSYANCFIPFLVPYYRNIIVIDPRYYYDNIESLITDNEITDILFLYNVNTFLGDTSLGDVLAAE
ncbi:MAG: DHHW family protein [Blautia sp.]|uniref:DHHW family protein n=1 Tax=Blautia sp. TaxID=1955243 RepID=UPI002E7A5002|nr:DHHW family protein [Blautia sp.]MEE1442374.1 DHHW family protein [Blautia sp.]